MTKKLQKNLSILFVVLLGTIWIAGLILFNYVNYQNNLRALKEDVRLEIRETGWKSFLASGGENADLGDIEYCIFKIGKDRQPVLCVNHFSDVSAEHLMQYGKQLSRHWRHGDPYLTVAYIFRRSRKFGKYIVLISGKQALRASFPVIIGSIVAAVVGLLGLALIARKLSDILVRPVDEMLMSEKKFMSNTSHELKTPLTVIRANTELLRSEIGENKHLQYIEQETERMISMVNEMLTLMRLDTPMTEKNHKAFPVDEALCDVIYPMESIAYEKKIQIDSHIQENMRITGNEEQIKQLMSILLDNAVSYSPEGVTIRVEAGIHGKRFLLSVANPGEPITEEEKNRIFERFYRRDEAREQSGGHFGLGLSIAGSIVANHHGKITVESKDGKNFFQVNLPVSGK